MARRLGILAIVVALGGVAFWAARNATAPDEPKGLVVRVTVLEADGKPVRGAQVRPRFSQALWQTVDGAGKFTLHDVPLKAGKDVTAASLRDAIAVRARFLGVRADPDVAREGDGVWQAVFTLEPHGVLRLSIGETHLVPIKAWIEPDERGRFEAMGGRNVARMDRPATFRVQPRLKNLIVRVEGEADPLGNIRAASQRLEIEAPRDGIVKQIMIKPEAARPIVGTAQVALPDGGNELLDIDGAEIVVQTIEKQRPAHELGRVGVKKGQFLIPFSGLGPYALTLHAPMRAPGPMKVAAGGTEVMLIAGRKLPWIRFTHRELDPKRRRLRLRMSAADGAPVGVHGPLHPERSWSRVVLREPAKGLQVRAEVPGTQKEPPLHGEVSLDAVDAEGLEIALPLTAAPHGTVQVAVDASSEDFGSLVLGDRKTTLIPGASKPARIKHVPAQERLPLVVTWKKPGPTAPDYAMHVATVDVTDGDTVTHEVPRIVGGFVRLHGSYENRPTVHWEPGESPYGDTSGRVEFIWDGGWRSAHALKPGKYSASYLGSGQRGGGRASFTIKAGETVTASAIR